MARENEVYLRGAVARKPLIGVSPDGTKFASVYVNVGRGPRDVGDGAAFMRIDNPLIMTREPAIIEEISKWHTYDIVEVKGAIATRTVPKGSRCKYCGEINSGPGMLVYIYPAYVAMICRLESPEQCKEYIYTHREMTNQVRMFATLLKDPEKIVTKGGLSITQYPVVTYRVLRIREDDPRTRADFPTVKCYGAIAEEDAKRLVKGSEIYVNGCIQVRSVLRHTLCGAALDKKGKTEKDENGFPRMRKKPDGEACGCGSWYDWEERATEIVPYSVEYTGRYKSDDEISMEERAEGKENDP